MKKKRNLYGKEMFCPCCTTCYEHPYCPGRCIYGGPHVYMKAEDAYRAMEVIGPPLRATERLWTGGKDDEQP